MKKFRFVYKEIEFTVRIETYYYNNLFKKEKEKLEISIYCSDNPDYELGEYDPNYLAFCDSWPDVSEEDALEYLKTESGLSHLINIENQYGVHKLLHLIEMNEIIKTIKEE